MKENPMELWRVWRRRRAQREPKRLTWGDWLRAILAGFLVLALWCAGELIQRLEVPIGCAITLYQRVRDDLTRPKGTP